MIAVFDKFLGWVDRQNITVGEWLTAFTSVVFIRCMLEVFSNPSSSGFIASDAPTVIHYWLAFIEILLGLACIIYHYSGHAVRLGKLLLFGAPIIWVGPSLDILISRGAGVKMGYFFDGPLLLILNFFAFLTPWSMITPGLKIEMWLIVFGCGFYVWLVRRSTWTAIKAGFVAYVFLFVMFGMPGILYLLSHPEQVTQNIPSQQVVDYFDQTLAAAIIGNNALHGSFQYSTAWRALEIHFDYFEAQINYLASCIFLGWWLYRAYPQKFIAVIKNARPERIGFYLVILAMGMGLAAQRGLVQPLVWIDGLSIMTLVVTWVSAWMFAVHTNDIADKSIDVIANRVRPLIHGDLTTNDMQQSSFIWLALALIGAWSAGYYPFFLCLVFTASYYLYSVHPLRLKRVPIISSALIAFAVICTFLAGFFFISADKKLSAFPMHLIAGVMLIFTLGVNVRDIKDIEGDKAEGIMTLPVLFGKYGIRVTAALFALSFLLAPLVFGVLQLLCLSIPAAFLGYALAIREPYNERWIFMLYFSSSAISIALIKFFVLM